MNKNENREQALAEAIGAKLKRLPELRAPESIMAAVMHRIREAEQTERLIDRVLKQLPDREAPATLVPRILSAIAWLENRPWWRRSWGFWPLWMKWLSMTLAGFCLGLLTVGAAKVMNTATVAARMGGDWLQSGPIGTVLDAGAALAGAGVLLVQQAGAVWLAVAAGIFLLMYGVCIGFGTMCVRVALRHR